MIDPVFTGVAAATVTFFDEHGSVDAATTARHAAHLAERGVKAIVVAGTTGEASHLSMKERLMLLDAVRAAVPSQVPVIIGTGALPPGVSSAELTKRSIDHGADAAVALSPHHGDVREFYEDIASAAGSFPVLAYHYPKVSQTAGIDVDLLPLLPIAGLKDSTGDPTRMLEQLARYDGPVYTGSAAMVLYASALGCAGAILAAANLEPELAAKAFDGDVDAQKALLDAHLIASFDSPHGLKQELHARFGTSPHCRHHHSPVRD